MKTTFTFTLTSEQFAVAVRYRNQQRALRMPLRRSMKFFSYVAWLAMIAALFTAQYYNGYSAVTNSLYVMALAYTGYSLLHGRSFDRLYRSENHLIGVSTEISVEEDGLHQTSPNYRSTIAWASLRGVEESDELLLLVIDEMHFLPVPTSAFESPAEKAEFVADINRRIAAAGSVAITSSAPPLVTTAPNVIAPTAEPAEPQIEVNHWRALQINLVNAVKLTCLRPLTETQLVVSWWQAAAFAIIGLLPPVIYDVATTGVHGEVAWNNFPEALVHLPIFLFAAVATAYAMGRGDRTPVIFQSLLMIAVVVDTASYLVYENLMASKYRAWFDDYSSYILILSALWIPIAYGETIRRNHAAPLHRRMWASIVCSILVIYPLMSIERDRSLWHRPFSQDELAETNLTGQFGEDNLYNQRELLERELAAVQPGRPGVVEIYFIGMAGYGGQNVFMKEVNAVSELFQQRFGAAGKTIRLINNRKQPGAAPLASVTSLGAALQRVGAVMNKDEDLLFLFLTSHGSKDHQFSLDLWPLRFHDLDPKKLRALLDESGIKNRVVVVSACYSGGFVDALKNDDTLVITASAPDKNSFGCSNDADWTYFGRAYFDEALRKTYSFTEAFKLANPVIAAREVKEDFTPSDPRLALGAALKPKLLQLEKQLAERR
ncbi:MAG: hypothetical protein EXR70_14820 [Deltaproteobacteria bacterium]|nr:hypothetical protein [Deltaproteobacteria bacterium]